MTVRQLSVSADLTIDVGDHQVRIRGSGVHIDVEFASVAVAFGMIRDQGKVGLLKNRIARISETLSTLGLTVIVRTPRRRLISMGQDGDSRFLGLFGLPNARIHLS